MTSKQRTTRRNRPLVPEVKRHQVGVWKITVSGYGSFQQLGTEADAEEMREHKAKWEHGVGRKEWVRNATSPEVLRWNEQGPFDPE